MHNLTLSGVTRLLRTASNRMPRLDTELVYLAAWINMTMWLDLQLKTMQIPSTHHLYINATLP